MSPWSASLALLLLCAATGDTLAASLYLDGLTEDGNPVRAVVGGGASIAGSTAACATCHGRSGLGRAEGPVRPLPITASFLFAPRTTLPRRPAYDDAALMRAVITGVAADGRQLNALMPRYRLGALDQKLLLAELHRLGVSASAGVTTEQITIATIVAESAPLREREAVSAVLSHFVAQKNGGSRNELRRAEQARRHPFGDRRDRAYRRWRLLEWTLSGPPTTWPSQLRKLYDADSPFAVVSGATGGNWNMVAQFCEAQHLPCVLPLAEQDDGAQDGFYSLFYSDGPRLEARITARHLISRLGNNHAHVSVVRREDARSRMAMTALSIALAEAGYDPPHEIVLSAKQRTHSTDWRGLAATPVDALVVWLDSRDIAALLGHRWLEHGARPLLYTAESFTDWTQVQAGKADIDNILHVYPYRLGNPAEDPFPRETAWLKSQGLLRLDGRAAGRALFACHAFGEALGEIENNFSREYLLETLEHMLDDTGMTSLFPRTGLGPGQRVLTRGAYVAPPSSVLTATARGTTWVEL